ncbi:MAG: RIP metalloprotease RseP [Gemmatimonadetes bacterium]|nr:RIP metalloprotease RseP [Gemmatimonadota bacterium]NIQ59105.1 RIP metalloprotease RseP [Gemmatimonadota bacterium]NIU79308.1 RIP metalloprotease RseP [Gammaproteobacteria bacterium]NIX47980.1 RIP metalloprotease RseP [Gemmatimonadota bacterium]NIY12353.1 RIP metalloprotease RseP [Gemmatimonadota bacterium]
MITIIATIVILGVLIFVHELGHFATAKWVDIEVPRFSIGLGPKMIGFTRGETEYVIAWLPLGGYVRMAGMDDMEALEGGEHDAAEARTSGRDFESKSLPARALVISAGVIMNILFAWFLFSVIGLVWGVRQAPEPVVGNVVESLVTPETAALLEIPVGARITAVNGEPVADWTELQRAVMSATDSVRFELDAASPVTVPVPEADTPRAALPVVLEPAVRLPADIGRVVEASPAAAAGLQPGDRVVEIEGRPIDGWQAMVRAVEPVPGQALEFVVERDGRRITLEVTPEAEPMANGGEIGRIGVGQPAAVRIEDGYPRDRMGPIAAVVYGGEQTVEITVMIVDYLVGLFTGEASARDVGGPILIYQISERVVQIGLDAFLNFMALFSINLAILNLLPIPILDGGQLVFLAVEGVRGRALSLEQRMRLSQVGLVLVVAIMVWALANDVLRLFGL